MQFEEYEIVTITPEVADVYLLRLKPKKRKYIPNFKPGQFYHLKNPTYLKPNETRQFSVITTIKIKDYLEFCIKTYGPWTKALLAKKPGESIWLFGPMGQFTLNKKNSEFVFIAGGVGIAPMLSMIQTLSESPVVSQLTLIYANKSKQHIVKKNYIENLFNKNPSWKLHFLVTKSDPLPENVKHRRIDELFMQEEVATNKTTIFFVCGSDRFTQNITKILQNLTITQNRIRQEIFLPPYPPKKKKKD
jgi:ferredoxin-NADP reductase